jgi:membrane-bound lytic murein transglycosylase C
MKIVWLLLVVIIAQGQTYEAWLKERNAQFQHYKDDFNNRFLAYKEAEQKAFASYKKKITKKWPLAEITTPHTWVEYGKDFSTKKKVDFDKGEVKIEVHAQNDQEAEQKFEQTFQSLLNDDVQSAYKNDGVSRVIAQTLHLPTPTIKENQKIIADVLPQNVQYQIAQNLKTQSPRKQVYKNQIIYTKTFKLPSNALLKKASLYRQYVARNASSQEIPPALIYAVIHSESSFNPMARSHIPAFGLMQIVPKSAGIDAYEYLYNKKKLLSSSYLYKADNNIEIGAAYLHVVYYRYLRHITNETSRLYCTIAAYNTGAGNVARTFIGTNNIKRASQEINRLTPEEVYQTLLQKLPYDETKKYLQRVHKRVGLYGQLLRTKAL